MRAIRSAYMICIYLILGSLLLPHSMVGAANRITWGSIQTGTYDSPSIYTLNWSGNVLDKGGYSIAQHKLTSVPEEADFVIDYKGSIGAAAIALLDSEALEASSSPDGKAFSNTQKLVPNGVYLIQLSAGDYIKLRVDRNSVDYSGSIMRVHFSYVLERNEAGGQQTAPKPEPDPVRPQPVPVPSPSPSPSSSPTPIPQPQPPTDGRTSVGLGDPQYDLAHAEYSYEVEEGPVLVPWKEITASNKYEVYRSDNGADYVKMNDFSLTRAEFTDHYAFAGHSYVYKLVSYDARNKPSYSPPVKIVVNKKAPNSKPTIELTLDSLKAKVNGQQHSLDAAPTLVNNRTMVPLRFIAEALGVRVEWNGEERSVTLQQGDQSIGLQIDHSEAVVNGQKVMMDVPAMIIQETTMVPVRFVSEHFMQEVLFDNDTKKITIASTASSSTDESPLAEQPKDNPPPDEQENLDPFYLGTWELWVPGVGSDVPGTGQGTFKHGSMGGILTINRDFTWQYLLGTNTYTGKWSQVENSSEILLTKFQYGSDWQGRNKGGVFQIYTFGMYFVASKLD